MDGRTFFRRRYARARTPASDRLLFGRLLENILTDTRTAGRADAATIMLFDDERRRIDFTLMVNQRTGTRLGGQQRPVAGVGVAIAR